MSSLLKLRSDSLLASRIRRKRIGSGSYLSSSSLLRQPRERQYGECLTPHIAAFPCHCSVYPSRPYCCL